MKKRQGKLVTNQRIGVRDSYSKSADEGNKNDSNNTYSNWVNSGTEEAKAFTSNEDNLADEPSNRLWGAGVAPELATRIVEEFADEHGNFPILSKQENMILRLYITTGDMAEVQRRSKLSRSSINTYMARIRSKMLRLLKSRDF